MIPNDVWTPAYNSDGDVREGAWVAEATGLLDLSGLPPGMRVIASGQRQQGADRGDAGERTAGVRCS